jgi:hypothetical protein
VIPSFGGSSADHALTDIADSCRSVRRRARERRARRHGRPLQILPGIDDYPWAFAHLLEAFMSGAS